MALPKLVARWWAPRPVLWGAAVGAVAGALIAWGVNGRLLALDAVAWVYAVLFCAAAGAVYVLLGCALGVFAALWPRILLGVLLAPVVLWLSADLLYSVLVKRSYAVWEASITRDANGVRQGCEGYTVGDGSTALLLVHGFGDSPATWRRMTPALAARGFTCEVMRLPHFAMPFDDYCRATADEWSAAVADHLAALRKTHARVVVVAHSLGCTIVLDALARHPDAADAVVLLAPLIEISTVRSPWLTPRTWFTLADHLLVFTDRIGLALPRDIRDREALKEAKIDQFMPRAIYRELFKLLDRNQAHPPLPRVPVLMFLADGDPVVDNEVATKFFEDCGSPSHAPQGRLVKLDDSGHMIPLDQEWSKVVHDIARFVESLPEGE
jgi:alpha-beta hydrolase superfamily lysophospholipase